MNIQPDSLSLTETDGVTNQRSKYEKNKNVSNISEFIKVIVNMQLHL